MIPHIIHQVWVGSGSIPAQQEEWVRKWRRLHPYWEHKLWSEKATGILSLGDEEISSSHVELLKSCTPVQKSEIWRIELLLQQGGVYLDTDIEPLKPIDSLLSPYEAAISPMWMTPAQHYASSFLAASPHHAWIEDMHKNLTKECVTPTVSRYITEVTKLHPEVKVLDRKYIAQTPVWDFLSTNMNKRPDVDVVAVHHFLSSFHI